MRASAWIVAACLAIAGGGEALAVDRPASGIVPANHQHALERRETLGDVEMRGAARKVAENAPPAEERSATKESTPGSPSTPPGPKDSAAKRAKPERATRAADSDFCMRNCVREWLSAASCQGSWCLKGAMHACRAGLRASGGNCDRYR